MDYAKVVAVLLAHGGHPGEYVGTGKLPGEVAPLVAVPTTSGTGSEVTQTAVVTHEGVKRGISDERLRHSFALVDPRLTYDLPRDVTARAGFDAFVHALEGLTARDHRCGRRVADHLPGGQPRLAPAGPAGALARPRAARAGDFDGDDREARQRLSLGSCLAALAHSNSGLGAVHALASSVGGITGRPHGECLAVSVEPAVEYNLPVRREEYAAVAAHLEVGESAAALVAEVARLRDSVGLPSSMAEFDLDASDADGLVEATLVQERRLLTNPREVTGDLRGVLVEALD
jgi:alcohol dehydrogenase class IV